MNLAGHILLRHQVHAILKRRAMQYAGNFMNELYLKAKVVDNRYLFF